MALGPVEQTAEVNAPQKRGAIVNEAEVKMSGWSRQIKEMRVEADVWWVHLKRDWHMRKNEREPENFNLSELWSYFSLILPDLLCFGISPQSLIIPIITDDFCSHSYYLPSFKCGKAGIRSELDWKWKNAGCTCMGFQYFLPLLHPLSKCTCSDLSGFIGVN